MRPKVELIAYADRFGAGLAGAGFDPQDRFRGGDMDRERHSPPRTAGRAALTRAAAAAGARAGWPGAAGRGTA
jgi:hypothetical protein